MAFIHPNNEKLIEHLEALPLFEGRFKDLRFANLRRKGDKEGSFSIVFRAVDVTDGKTVAIKFYDLHPYWMNDDYRKAAFARESDLLKSLIGAPRCLQLRKARSLYTFKYPIPGAAPAEFGCQYIVFDWLDIKIDSFFSTSVETPESKLRLFNEIVLAVEALHHKSIFHRDLKAGNLRATSESGKRVVIAIDLGCAARVESGYLRSSYGEPVGTPQYAAPEAVAGLVGNRLLGMPNDSYALGCLLFELFNKDLCVRAIYSVNPDLPIRLGALAQLISTKNNDSKQRVEWDGALDRFAPGYTSVAIDGPGSFCPLSINGILNEVVASLTHIDYRRRMGLDRVRARIWSAIRVLSNQREEQRRTAHTREMRRRRRQKVEALDKRFRASRALPGDSNAH